MEIIIISACAVIVVAVILGILIVNWRTSIRHGRKVGELSGRIEELNIENARLKATLETRDKFERKGNISVKIYAVQARVKALGLFKKNVIRIMERIYVGDLPVGTPGLLEEIHESRMDQKELEQILDKYVMPLTKEGINVLRDTIRLGHKIADIGATGGAGTIIQKAFEK